MGNIKFETETVEYPIAIQISIGKDRRIRLPKLIDLSTPYVLLENTQADRLWLGICGTAFSGKLAAEYNNLQVITEYRTCRPTIPKTVCDKHGLLASTLIWLVITGDWIEILPESSWQAEVNKISFR